MRGTKRSEERLNALFKEDRISDSNSVRNKNEDGVVQLRVINHTQGEIIFE
jgi:hypothetical protein